MTTGTYRSEVECLRAENERLTARVAELEAKSKRSSHRLVVEWAGAHGEVALLSAGQLGIFALALVGTWATHGWVHPVPMASAGLALVALAWCLVFVRRVPR